MGEPELQLKTNYFPVSLEAVTLAGGGLGSETEEFSPTTTGQVGFGGKLCLDLYRFNNVDTQSGAFSGLGGGLCGAYLRNTDGGFQIRGGGGVAILMNDAQFVLPIQLNYLYRSTGSGNVQHGGVFNLGLNYYFRTYEDGRGVDPYLGGAIGIGGLGGDNFGGAYVEIQVNGGLRFNLF